MTAPVTARSIRVALGLSMDRFAKALGLSGASTWQPYDRDGARLPVRHALAIWDLVQERGLTAICLADVLSLTGLPREMVADPHNEPEDDGGSLASIAGWASAHSMPQLTLNAARMLLAEIHEVAVEALVRKHARTLTERKHSPTHQGEP